MKIYHIGLLALGVLFLSECKTKDQVEADKISGGWKISQVEYSQLGSSKLDSTVTYTNSSFDFGSCKLNSSNRECYGYYSLNGIDRTAVSYGVSQESNITLTTVDQKNRKGIDLTGSFNMQRINTGALILSGPAGYVDSNGSFHSQALSVRITLIK